MSLLDDFTTFRVSFRGTIESDATETDLVEWIKPQRVTGGFVELVELYLAIEGEAAPDTNEHLGMSLIHLYDTSLNLDIIPGEALGSASVAEWTVGFLQEWMNDYGSVEPRSLWYTATVTALNGIVATANSEATRELYNDGWNIQIPFKQVWTKPARPTLAWTVPGEGGSEALVWRLFGSPTEDVSVRGHMVLRALDLHRYFVD